MNAIFTHRGNYFESKVVTTNAANGDLLRWQIFIGLVKSDSPKEFAEGQVPDALNILSMPILPQYENNSAMDPKIKGYKITATWRNDGKPILKMATFITKGKNETKENRTNTWTQTVAEAVSDYKKRNKPNEKQDLILPMLASGEATEDADLDKVLKKIWKKHTDNIRTQIKYDGIRMMVKFSKDTPVIFAYSRSGEKIYISEKLMAEFQVMRHTIFSRLPAGRDIYLDGEYYSHGESLQDISGAVRFEGQNAFKDKLVYHVFDIVTTIDSFIVPDDCRTRLWWVHMFAEYYPGLKLVEFVKSEKPECWQDIKADYMKKRSENYEGLILRVSNKPYVSGRNTNMMKLKPSFREEFLITGYKEAKGKHAGLIIFKCQLTEASIQKAKDYMVSKGKEITDVDITCLKDITFSVTPAATEEDRKKMLEDGDSYIGKLYTVEFQDWTNMLKPQRPKGIAIYTP